MENNRASFGSNFGFLMAAIGSAVGLGNIWGFPYKMGMSGGFAFLLVYLVLAVLVGLAVMVGEFTIGRKTGMSPVAAYRKLSKKFTWLGYMAVICPFLVLCFYFVLGGMVMRYALGYLTAIFGWDTWGVANIADYFGSFIMNGGQMILWTAIFIALNALIVAAGVAEGIEKTARSACPLCLSCFLSSSFTLHASPVQAAATSSCSAGTSSRSRKTSSRSSRLRQARCSSPCPSAWAL